MRKHEDLYDAAEILGMGAAQIYLEMGRNPVEINFEIPGLSRPGHLRVLSCFKGELTRGAFNKFRECGLHHSCNPLDIQIVDCGETVVVYFTHMLNGDARAEGFRLADELAKATGGYRI